MLVVLVWFSPWWIGGKNLAPLDLLNHMMSPWRTGSETHDVKNHNVSDGVDEYLIYHLIAEKSYHEEGWVGWSSLTYGGTAQYANTMALYYDWTMQLHRWFNFWTAWHLGLMGQVMLAVSGMFLFLRGRSIGQIWACCGALAYAANSQFVTWVNHRWTLSAFCWVPWILWAIDRQRRNKTSSWGLVPLFIGMAFLGGTLQHAALVVLAVAALWAEEASCTHYQAGQQARVLGRYLIWGLLGTGLAAMMFIPCTDALITSNRLGLHTGLYGNAENGAYPQGALQPLFNLAAYPLQIFPSVLGRCNSVSVLKLFKSDAFYVAYFGSLPVLISFIAVWRKNTPLSARLLIACGLLLPLTPMVRILYQRVFLLFILGGILAFAHFMETAKRETRLKICRITALLTGIITIAWTSLSLLLLARPDLLFKVREKIVTEGKGSTFGYFDDWIAGRADRFIGDLFIWSPQQLLPLLMFAAALIGLYWTASNQEKLKLKGSLFVAFAVIGEVSLFGARWITWADPIRDPLYPITPETTALRDLVGKDGRITTLIHPTAHMALTPFIPNTLAAYGVATISGFDSIIPNGMIRPNESPGDAENLGRLGVSHLITWHGNPDIPDEWKPVWNSESMDLYENPKKTPRYLGFLADADKDAFFSGMRYSGLFVSEISGKENSRLLDVPANVRWIRIAENQAEGWKYRIRPTEEWLQVQRSPDASMLIPIPTSHNTARIEMRYNPPLRRMGFAVSTISLLLLIAGTIRVARTR